MIDYIIKHYIEPIGDGLIDAIYTTVNWVLTAGVVLLICLTLPLWFVPYVIIKYKRKGEFENE